MMFWERHGYLVFLITAFVSLVLVGVPVDAYFGDRYYENNLWINGLGVALGGLVSAIVGVYLNRKIDRNPRLLIDEQTGERVSITEAHHRFFGFRMEWAGVVLMLIGIYISIENGLFSVLGLHVL